MEVVEISGVLGACRMRVRIRQGWTYLAADVSERVSNDGCIDLTLSDTDKGILGWFRTKLARLIQRSIADMDRTPIPTTHPVPT